MRCRDINGLVNLPELMQNKYCTHQYYGSKVLAFDDEAIIEKVSEEDLENKGFMSHLSGKE